MKIIKTYLHWYFIILCFLAGVFLLNPLKEFASEKPPTLNINNAINNSIAADNKLSAPQTTTIIFGGDVMLSRTVGEKIREYNDFSWPFKKIDYLLKDSDLSIINLESPFIKNDSYIVPSGSFIFKADPKTVAGLKLAGIDLASLANNHFGNEGQKGMLDTFQILADDGIKYVGAGKNIEEAHQGEIMEVNGIKFGFLGYAYPQSIYVADEKSAGISNMNIALAKEDISRLRKQVDFLTILMHAGNEYTDLPNDEQKNFAHLAIDSGADLVVGHHPHWIQPVEIYHGKLILYSLGNLVFDQMWSRETQQGILAKAFFTDGSLEKMEFIPIHILDYGQPEAASEENEIKQILEKIKLDRLIINL